MGIAGHGAGERADDGEARARMGNPVTRIKEILGEILRNGRAGLENQQAQQRRFDGLEHRLGEIEAGLLRVSAQLGGGEVAAAEGIKDRAGLVAEEVRQRILRLAVLLEPWRARGVGKVRVGDGHDGGYVMLDDWQGLAGALSIGIGSDDAWDRAMNARGLRVAQYDHTITAPPRQAEGLAWQPVGVGADDVNNLRTLRSLIALAGLPERGDLLLKMDVEAAEWEALAAGPEAAPLDRFRQMVVELHWFERVSDPAWFAAAEAALRHLARHHAVVHVHANNWGGMALVGGIAFPRVLEVTWARRDAYALEPETGFFPTPLDAPCDPSRPDLFLGTFRFPPPVTTA